MEICKQTRQNSRIPARKPGGSAADKDASADGFVRSPDARPDAESGRLDLRFLKARGPQQPEAPVASSLTGIALGGGLGWVAALKMGLGTSPAGVAVIAASAVAGGMVGALGVLGGDSSDYDIGSTGSSASDSCRQDVSSTTDNSCSSPK